MSPNNLMTRKSHQIRWLAVERLSVIWAEAQREINPKKVARIAASLDPDALGVLAVAAIGDRYHIIDGQHRCKAVEQFAGPKERIACMVIEGCETPQQAAEIWITINTERSKPSSHERFRVAVEAGHPTEVEVMAIVEAAGLTIGRRENGVVAVAACMSVYRNGGAPALEWVFATSAALWGAEGMDGRQAAILLGLGEFWGRFGSAADTATLAKKVSKRYTPSSLIGAAKAARDMFKGGLASNVLRVLVAAHNKGLASSRCLLLGE